jgi:hypothetical protein
LIVEAGQRRDAIEGFDAGHVLRRRWARRPGGLEPGLAVRVGTRDPAVLEHLLVEGLAGQRQAALVENEHLVPRIARGLNRSIHDEEHLAGLQERLKHH